MKFSKIIDVSDMGAVATLPKYCLYLFANFLITIKSGACDFALNFDEGHWIPIMRLEDKTTHLLREIPAHLTSPMINYFRNVLFTEMVLGEMFQEFEGICLFRIGDEMVFGISASGEDGGGWISVRLLYSPSAPALAHEILEQYDREGFFE